MNLPPLTEKIDRGAAGGNEFERLMHQLLLRYGDKERFAWEIQWERFLGHSENVLRLLKDPDTWDDFSWLNGPRWGALKTKPRANSAALQTDLQNPVALPFLIGDIWAAASTNIDLACDRAIAVGFSRGELAGEAIDLWLLGHPIDLYATAFAWEHHAAAFSTNIGRLAGPHGALMLAHAAFAALMTGLSLDTPTWTNLIAGRDTEDPCVVFGHALYQLCSLHDRDENGRIVQSMLDAPPEPLRAILDPFAHGT